MIFVYIIFLRKGVYGSFENKKQYLRLLCSMLWKMYHRQKWSRSLFSSLTYICNHRIKVLYGR